MSQSIQDPTTRRAAFQDEVEGLEAHVLDLCARLAKEGFWPPLRPAIAAADALDQARRALESPLKHVPGPEDDPERSEGKLPPHEPPPTTPGG